MLCFVCLLNEDTVVSQKGFFDCQCEFNAHFECFVRYRQYDCYCPLCYCTELNSERIIENRSRFPDWCGILLLFSLLYDFGLCIASVVVLTNNNTNINNDARLLIPVSLLLLTDLVILSFNIALLSSRKRKQFRYSYVCSSVLYLMTLILSGDAFIENNNFSVDAINIMYALIIYQVFYIPRVFVYEKYF